MKERCDTRGANNQYIKHVADDRLMLSYPIAPVSKVFIGGSEKVIGTYYGRRCGCDGSRCVEISARNAAMVSEHGKVVSDGSTARQRGLGAIWQASGGERRGVLLCTDLLRSITAVLYYP